MFDIVGIEVEDVLFWTDVFEEILSVSLGFYGFVVSYTRLQLDYCISCWSYKVKWACLFLLKWLFSTIIENNYSFIYLDVNEVKP